MAVSGKPLEMCGPLEWKKKTTQKSIVSFCSWIIKIVFLRGKWTELGTLFRVVTINCLSILRLSHQYCCRTIDTYILHTCVHVYICFHTEGIKYAHLSNNPFISLRTLDFRRTLGINVRIGLSKTVKPFNNLWGWFCGATIFWRLGPYFD